MMEIWCPKCKKWTKIVDKYGREIQPGEDGPYHCSGCGHNFSKEEV